MYERHNIKIATFGANLNTSMEFKGTPFVGRWRGLRELIYVRVGMAGNQVLEWSDLDSEIKTAGLKDVNGVFFKSLNTVVR